MPQEMSILRNKLTEINVEWEDQSDDFDRSFPFFDMTLYKTRVKHNNHEYVISYGVGTQGFDWGLLELRVDGNSPVGSLTAQDILNIMLARG